MRPLLITSPLHRLIFEMIALGRCQANGSTWEHEEDGMRLRALVRQLVRRGSLCRPPQRGHVFTLDIPNGADRTLEEGARVDGRGGGGGHDMSSGDRVEREASGRQKRRQMSGSYNGRNAGMRESTIE